MHCHIDWHMTGIAQSYRCRHRCSYFLVYLMPLQHGADAMTFNDLFNMERTNTMTTQTQPVQFNIPTPAKASAFTGYHFEFTDQDTNIEVQASSWSGKESVVINGELISDKRVLTSTRSEHLITHDGREYRVGLHITNILTGNVECKLYRNDLLIGSQYKAVIEKPYTSLPSILKISVAVAWTVACALWVTSVLPL